MSSKIFYGVAGEGLGHASRVLSVIGHLPDCEIHVFTFGKAYHFFADMNYPHLHKIDGLMFSYRKNRVNYLRTAARTFSYATSGLWKNIRFIREQAEQHQPDLFITDFEPSTIRAAHKLKHPVLSIDNQHKFAYSRSKSLPFSLKTYAKLTGWFVRIMIPKPTETVIATFHADCQEKTRENVTLTGGILRKEVEEHPVTNDGFVLVYLRESVGDRVLESLVGCDRDVRVFGATEDQQQRYAGQFDFHPLSPAFVDHLASCDRVISTSGNQLISECRFFKKPILTIPEPGQYEQSINAHFVDEIGMGEHCELLNLSQQRIRKFLQRNQFEFGDVRNGVHEVTQVIKRHLPSGSSVECSRECESFRVETGPARDCRMQLKNRIARKKHA